MKHWDRMGGGGDERGDEQKQFSLKLMHTAIKKVYSLYNTYIL